MQRGGIRPAIGHGQADQNILGRMLGVFGGDVEIGDARPQRRQDKGFGRIEEGSRAIYHRAGSAKGAGEGGGRVDERAKTDFLEASFSDALAIYMLSLTLDFDYSELREREYPLLAPQALAERLRLVAKLFPANEGYEFAIRYRRRA